MKLTTQDIKILKNNYANGVAKFKRNSIFAAVLGLIGLVAPVEVWNSIKHLSRRRNDVEDFIDPIYTNMSMVIVILLFVIFAIVINYFSTVYFAKKDLESKEKIGGIFNVNRIEHLSPQVAEKLDGLDTVLHFEKNDSKIKKHLFNKSQSPELLNAKTISIEQSKYTSVVFKQEIQLEEDLSTIIIEEICIDDFGGSSPELTMRKNNDAYLIVEIPPFYDGEGNEILEEDFPEEEDFAELISEYVNKDVMQDDRETFIIKNATDVSLEKTKYFIENYWTLRKEKYK